VFPATSGFCGVQPRTEISPPPPPAFCDPPAPGVVPPPPPQADATSARALIAAASATRALPRMEHLLPGCARIAGATWPHLLTRGWTISRPSLYRTARRGVNRCGRATRL